VVNADAVTEDFREFAAAGGTEIGVVEGAGDGGFFLLGAAVGGKQVAGGVGAGVLGEVDEVNGRATLFVELGDFFLELGGGVFEFERDRGVMVGVSNKLNAGNASSKAGHPDLTLGMPTPGQPMLGQAFGIPSFGLPPSQQNR